MGLKLRLDKTKGVTITTAAGEVIRLDIDRKAQVKIEADKSISIFRDGARRMSA